MRSVSSACTWFLLLACIWTGSAGAAQTVKLAVVTKPGSAQAICAEKFAELASAASQGELQVELFHSGSMGNETEILQKLQGGQIQIAVVTVGPFDEFVPETRVVEFPFLFKNHAHADRVLDGKPGQTVLDALEKAGFKGLAFSENGFRHLTNNKRPVHDASQVKDLKIRVMNSALQEELWTILGARPIPHPWPIDEFLAAGGIDGQENPIWVLWEYRFDKLQRYLTLTGHVYSAHICAANLNWFESLPAALQGTVRRAMQEAALYQRSYNRGHEKEYLTRLKEAGMQVDEHPDLDSFHAKTADIASLPLFREPDVKRLLDLFMNASR
ncbi:MAG: TRAP transporter substrate-binding protein DctP [Deltaproteobacteria bacterium]|nr:TRAP transporter substrate-binding protein DctP [Deltaproteobacteria bacterium]